MDFKQLISLSEKEMSTRTQYEELEAKSASNVASLHNHAAILEDKVSMGVYGTAYAKAMDIQASQICHLLPQEVRRRRRRWPLL